MISPFVVRIEAYWHEVAKLYGKPKVEQIRIPANQVSADENVEHSSDERKLLSGCHSFCVVPPRTKTVHGFAHTFPVLFELLIWWR